MLLGSILLADLKELAGIGIKSVIVGKAFYSGALDNNIRKLDQELAGGR